MLKGFYEWFAMGGYASYVWISYGVAAFVFTGHLISIMRHQTRIWKQLNHWFDKGK